MQNRLFLIIAIQKYKKINLFIIIVIIIANVDKFLSEGGFFKAHLYFPVDYPLKPPKMKFISEIWHSNSKSKLDNKLSFSVY
jgi:ubiquitin-protein ligase